MALASEQSIRDQTTPSDSNEIENGTGPEGEGADFDPSVTFAEEKEGWRGYIEWEKYSDKKAKAAEILASHKFPPPPEFQLGPIPDTNPVLEGERWKMWHKA